MFKPFPGYCEVEPIESSSVISNDRSSYVEKAKVISISYSNNEVNNYEFRIDPGDYIFFRPHGFFTIAEHEGKVRHVVRVHPEFLLGISKPAVIKKIK